MFNYWSHVTKRFGSSEFIVLDLECKTRLWSYFVLSFSSLMSQTVLLTFLNPKMSCHLTTWFAFRSFKKHFNSIIKYSFLPDNRLRDRKGIQRFVSLSLWPGVVLKPYLNYPDKRLSHAKHGLVNSHLNHDTDVKYISDTALEKCIYNTYSDVDLNGWS